MICNELHTTWNYFKGCLGLKSRNKTKQLHSTSSLPTSKKEVKWKKITVIHDNKVVMCPKPRKMSMEQYLTWMPYSRNIKVGLFFFWWTSYNYLNGNNLILRENFCAFVPYWYANRLTVNWNSFWFASGRGQKHRKSSEENKKTRT